MNPKVPRAAAGLLDYIGNKEAPQGYDTVYGGRENMAKMPKRLSTMTMKEVLDQGRWRTARFKSSACGRYQFMDETLRSLAKELDLKAEDIFTPDYQDWLGYRLLLRRGYAKWARGEMSDHAFMIGLAKEWASFPVPYAMKGAHRNVSRGETYYAGDKLNRSYIDPAEVERLLIKLKDDIVSPPADNVPIDTDPVPDDPVVGFWKILQAAMQQAFDAYMQSRK